MNNSTAFLHYDIELSYGDFRDRLTGRTVLFPNGETKTYEDEVTNVELIKDLLKHKIKTVYVWNLHKWALFTDTEALQSVNNVLYEDLREARKKKLKEDYEDVERWFRFQPSQECFSFLSNGFTDYSRGYFYRVEKTYERKNPNGHGKTIKKTTISSCLFFGLSPFFGKQYTLESCTRAYFGALTTPCNDMLKLFEELDKITYTATNKHILKNGSNAIPNFVTIGAIAKKSLLKSCGFNSVRAFHSLYDIDKETEQYFRKGGLSTNGILYYDTRRRNRVLENVYKLDVNSLYLYNALNSPMLGKPEEVPVDQIGHGTEIYEYIIEFGQFSAIYHKDRPNIYTPSVMGRDTYDKIGQIFEMKTNVILFYDEYEKLKEWAEIDATPVRAWRCTKNKSIFGTYCNYWYEQKRKAKEEGNRPLYQLSKLFCVCAWGKLQEQTIFPKIQIEMDIDGDAFEFVKNKNDIIDNWDGKHFYYIQGAYIYARSRVYMYNKIEKLENPKEDLIYSDTDSIVTDHLNGDEYEIDDYKLGAFKIEEFYEQYKCIGFKTYGGINTEGEIIVTCAGVNKTALTNEIRQKTGVIQFFKWFTPQSQIEVPVILRKNGGALYKFSKRRICDLAEIYKGGYVDKEL